MPFLLTKEKMGNDTHKTCPPPLRPPKEKRDKREDGITHTHTRKSPKKKK
jgi:hypothetical protein